MAVVTITKENFEAEVLHSTKPVLLDFWATWCGPCRMLSPIVDEVAEERTDVKVGKVNVDEQPELASQFGVMSIPTLLVFRDGKLVNQAVGARPKAGVLALLGYKTKIELYGRCLFLNGRRPFFIPGFRSPSSVLALG